MVRDTNDTPFSIFNSFCEELEVALDDGEFNTEEPSDWANLAADLLVADVDSAIVKLKGAVAAKHADRIRSSALEAATALIRVCYALGSL